MSELTDRPVGSLWDGNRDKQVPGSEGWCQKGQLYTTENREGGDAMKCLGWRIVDNDASVPVNENRGRRRTKVLCVSRNGSGNEVLAQMNPSRYQSTLLDSLRYTQTNSST